MGKLNWFFGLFYILCYQKSVTCYPYYPDTKNFFLFITDRRSLFNDLHVSLLYYIGYCIYVKLIIFVFTVYIF